ncbi:MAG: hypothetical protein KAV00_16260, partial [Phycisphaerae bacterium]|nr:hypothetical protein [Phycisphaerae bacterium]
MRNVKTILMLSAVLMFVAGPAAADWDPGDPYKMHWPQLPDLEYGLDVLAGPMSPYGGMDVYEKFLADDFLCTHTGPITEIHVWGSYWEDRRMDPPVPPLFNLVIYSDIPAHQSPTGYSMPGDPLWNAYLPATVERVYAEGVMEEFFDPNQDAIIGSDTVVWQYNFFIDEAEAFIQDEGEIYWLGLHHSYDLNGDGIVDIMDMGVLMENWPWAYGWKTSQDHFNDGAVWTDVDS